jgi:hypothetical protein
MAGSLPKVLSLWYWSLKRDGHLSANIFFNNNLKATMDTAVA